MTREAGEQPRADDDHGGVDRHRVGPFDVGPGRVVVVVEVGRVQVVDSRCSR